MSATITQFQSCHLNSKLGVKLVTINLLILWVLICTFVDPICTLTSVRLWKVPVLKMIDPDESNEDYSKVFETFLKHQILFSPYLFC